MRAAGLLLLLPLLLVPLASAHAELRTATPAPGGHADEGVTIVEIVFRENIERQYTTADVIDQNGASVAAGPVEFDETRENVIRLAVAPLTSGIYSASWKALSIDTHTTRGQFVFAVGTATLREGEYPIFASDPRADDAGAVAREGFARFAFYAGLFLAVGMPLFALAVLREPPPRMLFTTAASFGAVGAAGAMVGLLFLQDRTSLGWGVIDTDPGASLLWRGILLLGAAVACIVAVLRPAWWKAGAIGAIALGALAIYQTSTGSHGAAVREGTTLYVLADAVHLAAAAVWVGGVVALLHLLAMRVETRMSVLVFRFTALAIPSLALLLFTGSLASLAHMPCFDDGLAACVKAAPQEPYMRLVALKLALMAPLIALVAYNAGYVRPRLERGAWTGVRVRRAVQAEAILLAIVVAAAGALAASAPPERDVEKGTQPLSQLFEAQDSTGKSHVILQIGSDPVTVGIAQKLIVIVHPLGPQLPNSTQVGLKIYPATSTEPEETVNATKVTPNEWELDHTFASAGTWKVTILLQRPDDEQRALTFEVPVTDPATPPAGS